MNSSTTLIKAFISKTKELLSVRRSDFQVYQGDILPRAQVMLDRIAKDVQREHAIAQETETEAMLTQSLASASTKLSRRCFASKKRTSRSQCTRIFR